MEANSENPQFDSYLGGSETVPEAVNISDFIKHRMEEIVMLTEAIEESPFRGQSFQRLPKHMRRRQMSHYIKRLPRRLQKPYLMSLKDEPPTPTKRPSRKYRRRPSNLLLEYNRRQKNSVWLETHIWHAKRFHMTSRWGYKLPEKPVNKSFKACYRAFSEHCLLIDLSYYNCIELKGEKHELLEGLQKCTSTECGLTFGAKMYLNGSHEGHLMLFHPNSYPYGAIGNVNFMWEAGDKGNRLWIWVHPITHNEVVECFKLLFHLNEEEEQEEAVSDNLQQEKKNIGQIKLSTKNVKFIRTPKYRNKTNTIRMNLLKDTLNRFHLTGPLSQPLVSQAFTLASVDKDIIEIKTKKSKLDVEIIEEKNWWEEYYGGETKMEAWFDKESYTRMAKCCRPRDLPPGIILGLVVEDPRLHIPAKREKAVSKGVEQITLMDSKFSCSPIWIPEIRDQVSMTKLTTHEINEARSKKIVPGLNVKDVIPDSKQSRIPILLVQKPGKSGGSGKLGLGSGWDIISPSGFGMPIWLSLIFRGARTGGLRESELVQLECNSLNEHLPPDSAGGDFENRLNFQQLKTEYFKLPPNKRANFRKLGVVSPFYLPWKVLVRDWISRIEPIELLKDKIKFNVLRDLKKLGELNEIVKKGLNFSKVLNWGLDRLIPVSIEYSGKGKPKDFALICIPEDKDFHGADPVEPPHVDENETERKRLRREHLKLLKSLKKKRKKERAKLKEEFATNLPGKYKWKEIIKKNLAPSEPHSKDYKKKMESLWLPDPDGLNTIVDSCSRKIAGFVVKGEFCFSRSCGLGLGYVTLPGLVELLGVCRKNKSKVVALVRNRDQVQYRRGRVSIGVE